MEEGITLEEIQKAKETAMSDDVLNRLFAERDELGVKICNLTSAIYSPATIIKTTKNQLRIMCKQLESMKEYFNILNSRIEDAKSYREYYQYLEEQYKIQNK